MSVLDKRRQAQPSPRAPLNTVEQVGGCCGSRLIDALFGGHSPQRPWLCPECGEEWRADSIGGAFHWMMRPVFLARGKVRKT